MGKSVIVINGNRIEIEGDATNVQVRNGTITVGGVTVASGLSRVSRQTVPLTSRARWTVTSRRVAQ
jgi:ribosomal protein L24